ncbi:MAG: ABC transporter permease [Hamadaea sp.]|uniref:ABC transporter permease n=1 Tax=Hamadaea sp. TaxID=2024425 RepID=UPI00179E2C90|nr:ABC transporter permease [Hamadaea sp.]NUR73495.1 ABC transporter permease [Hamadaea sp.]NUT21131.1 ABC transporter permease [Hamadaea sp.]
MAVSLFARLKLRVLRNGFRGKPARVVMFVLSLFFGVWFGGGGCLALIASMQPAYPELTALVPAFAGALLVLGWLFGPLLWFGVDETLTPAKFALLPIPRRTLIGGLLTAALIGVPVAATLLATAGLVVGTAIGYGVLPALVSALGVVVGLLMCVALSRSVTSAFANLLGSRRVRDLAAIGLALLAALLGPAQIFGISALSRADFSRLERFADILGWTPLAAPWSASVSAAHGDYLAAIGKIGIGAVTTALLLWWWSATIERAMLGATDASGPRRAAGSAAPVARLFGRLRWIPATAEGTMVVREARYWWRDTRRRANLITFAVLGVFLPVLVNLGSSPAGLVGDDADFQALPDNPAIHTATMVFVGVLGAIAMANQFGFDGTAYALHLATGVPGRREVRSRIIGYSVYIVPLIVVISILVTVLAGKPSEVPARIGTLLGAYGVSLAACVLVSVYGAYALPETSNPFAVNTGGGLAKSLLALVAMIGSVALSSPLILAAALTGKLWTWLALPVGLAYGLGAVWLGVTIGGDAVDRRGPELLVAVTPRG